MILLVTFLLVAISLPAHAAIWYVSPNGSGTACTQQSPCDWVYGTQTKASGSDTVRFLDGVYQTPTSGWLSSKGGTSSSARLTFEAVNRRQATIRYVGPNDADDTFIIRHSNYVIRGLVINCEQQSNGNNSWDCLQAIGRNLNDSNEITTSNVLFDDLYVRNSGHGLFHCTEATNVEIKNSTLDLGGETSERGEGLYLSSCCGKNNPCKNIKVHHTIISRYGENAVDFKDQTRDAVISDNIFADQRARVISSAAGPAGSTGTAVFVSQGDGGFGTSAASNIVRDSISFRGIAPSQFSSTDDIRFDAVDNVIWGFDPWNGNNGQINNNNSTEQPSTVSSNNIHCPASDNVSNGPTLQTNGNPNKLNRPNSECETRINEILGIPGISSCEIGSVNNTTLVVNLQANKNGPISSVGTAGQLAVTYNSTNQTENSITLTSGTQARIVMAAAPTAGQTVQVTPAVGSIKNSAFIGGKTCNLSINSFKNDPGGTNILPNAIANGEGVCGSNTTATAVTCTNNVGTTPGVETLDQAVFRFYAEHGAEGQNAFAGENASIAASLGDGFRWRVGVRGGGNNAPSRSYQLATRLCSPTCGQWLVVTDDFSATGITFLDDQVQTGGTATTNQLTLGGKTFLAGSFIETAVDTPAVAIASTQQVEWEFSLIIPRDNNPLTAGQSIELRIQHSDGTALATYTAVPSITIGSASSGITGAFTGTIQ